MSADKGRSEVEALVRWLANEGDGGIWEELTSVSARPLAEALVRSSWLADVKAAGAAEVVARVEAVLAKSFDLMPQQSLTPTARIECVVADDLRAALTTGGDS